jgi:hypothetical protein
MSRINRAMVCRTNLEDVVYDLKGIPDIHDIESSPSIKLGTVGKINVVAVILWTIL